MQVAEALGGRAGHVGVDGGWGGAWGSENMCADRFPELLSRSVPSACGQYRRSRSLLSLMVPCLRQFLPLEYTGALLQSAGVPVAYGSVQHRPLPEEMPSCVSTAPQDPPWRPTTWSGRLVMDLIRVSTDGHVPAARSCACVTL